MGKLLVRVVIAVLCSYSTVYAQGHIFSTRYARFRVSDRGYIISIQDKTSGKEYNPSGDSSALLSLYKGQLVVAPMAASWSVGRQLLSLSYPNGSVATIKVSQKGAYLRLQLVGLTLRDGVDNIIWGPYKTNISDMIGEIVSVVRDQRFAIGMQALDQVTTSGPPSEGDLYQSYYLIHAPPGVKLPANLHEGQIFNIGGDSLGSSDVAFFSQPAEYFRYILGNGAALAPYGSNIVLHARDRRIAQTINFKPSTMAPDRHQYVAPLDVDFMGSAVALFGCPEPATLPVIEAIELGEGLPHPMIDGKWVKSPLAAKPFLAWYGVHDSTVSYARQLGFEAIQDEGMGEYYYNPANRWDDKRVDFSGGRSMDIAAYTGLTNKAGIAFGLHTLCEFIQPNSSDVTPRPSDSLCRVGSTVLAERIGAADTIITIADPTYLRESGGWENIYRNVLKVDKELIGYGGVTASASYTLLKVERGWGKTQPGVHAAGDSIHKLMPNAYAGFAPDIFLQDKYAKDYARLLNEGGMDYIDFDGLESCWYQGHGQYSIKRFYDTLFRHLNHYIRNTGSCIFEGNWHYMSSLDVGGNLFDPAANQFKIQGKDFKYIYASNLLHFSFGVVDFSPGWNVSTAENLEAKAVGWDGQYMLGLSQERAERCGVKAKIFAAIHAWENARAANVFTSAQKRSFRVTENRFHLEQVAARQWKLYPVTERTEVLAERVGSFADSIGFTNPAGVQPMRLTIQLAAPGGDSGCVYGLAGFGLQVNGGKAIKVDLSLREGQYIVYENGQWFVADEHWNRLSEMVSVGEILLKPGENVVRIRGLVSRTKVVAGDAPVNMRVRVSLLGKGELLKSL